MRKIIIGIVIAFVVSFILKKCTEGSADKTVIREHSALIEKQINNVGKLVVTEGYFSDAYSYKSSKALFANLTSDKQALVIVNAEVTVSYDLSKIEYQIDSINKVLKIVKIPQEELKIYPDLEYYDVESGYLNAFNQDDYNKIKETVTIRIRKKIEASNLRLNAKNRLISELSKFYILTNSLGWTLQYNDSTIDTQDKLERFKL
ncbi:DUF4230 domain-containing protein [Olleya aquimaris]|uniref:DUF4230 domain-containing protein n=1 Tax=Olleya sediminilitoris TaxID=2795739 RepID=A0ABS1WJG1_9FLAO|nr:MULTISPECIES: DUF4230 domain-containing protein [Olleya]AXO81329.1 DUF4230 domain-containing protein [Olleya aquimaris]MBL7559256.1 DUF4230 domain-containing protein [Olleya sediminilitoris]